MLPQSRNLLTLVLNDLSQLSRLSSNLGSLGLNLSSQPGNKKPNKTLKRLHSDLDNHMMG